MKLARTTASSRCEMARVQLSSLSSNKLVLHPYQVAPLYQHSSPLVPILTPLDPSSHQFYPNCAEPRSPSGNKQRFSLAAPSCMSTGFVLTTLEEMLKPSTLLFVAALSRSRSLELLERTTFVSVDKRVYIYTDGTDLAT